MSAAAERVASETAAEYLRIAVPMMAQHRIPATPDNYATWYMYVSGENDGLNVEIDALIDEKTAFTAEVNTRLYRHHVAEHDLGNVERIRAGLNKILTEVGSTLSEAGDEARGFEGKLGGIANDVSDGQGLKDIRDLLTTLVEETRKMQTATSTMRQDFESKSQEIANLQEQLQHERKRAVTDPLTGLYNRLALLDRLTAAVGEVTEATPLSLVMIDIDDFKSVNDTHGHLIGDRVIRFVAQVLQKNTKGKDTAARYGGEEFTLLLPETPLKGAQAVAESIREAVANARLVRADNKKPLGRITISAGIASYRPREHAMELIGRADQALYRSKNDGRNRVTVGD